MTEVLAAFLLPWVAFALASPFIVSSLPLVIDHLGYELWHYGVAGHDGHSAEPGFAQLFFYGKWLVTDGGGVLPVVGALLGVYFFAKRRSKEEVIALLFPLCFLLLMVGQRANFTRNMIALIPFLGILAGCGVHSLLSQLRLGSTLPKIVPWVVVLIIAQPLIVSVRERAATINAPESRIELGTWLHSHQSPTVEFAVAGQLQVASEIRAISGVSIVNEVGLNARDVILNGITYVITSSRFVPPPGEETLWSKIHTIEGTPERQRIVDNPEIAIYKLTPSESYLTQLGASVASSPSLRLPVVLERGKDGALALTAQCDEVDSGEDRCWIKTRYTLLSLSIGEEARLNPRSQELVNISLPVYSPWRPQEMTLTAQGTTSTCAFGLTAASDWNVCTLSLPESVLAAKSSILVTVAAISSPASRGVNSDQRRLGVAIKRKAQ